MRVLTILFICLIVVNSTGTDNHKVKNKYYRNAENALHPCNSWNERNDMMLAIQYFNVDILSTQKEYKVKLDSVISFNKDDNLKEKLIYTYNNNGNLILVLHTKQQGDSITFKRKLETQYNNGLFSQQICFDWKNGDWQNSGKISFTYQNKKLTQWLDQKWLNNNWTNNNKIAYTYDSNNNIKQCILFGVDNLGDWVNLIKFDYTYTSRDDFETIIFSSWTSDKWTNGNKTTYTYDSNFRVESYLYYTWFRDDWNNSEKMEYLYNAQGNATQYMSFRWRNEEWVHSQKADYRYDASNNVNFVGYSIWTGTNWRAFSKEDKTYNGQYLESQAAMQESILPYPHVNNNNKWYGVKNNIVDSSTNFEWDTLSNAFLLRRTEKYYYSEFVTPILTNKNPSKQTSFDLRVMEQALVISIPTTVSKVSLYNLKGRMIKSIIPQKSGALVIDRKTLPGCGVYTIRAESVNDVFTRKVVLQ